MMRGWNLNPFASASSREAEGQEHAEKKQAEEEEEEEEERRKAEDDRFCTDMQVEGKFEEAMSKLDEADDTTARRLLGWAAFGKKPPDVIRTIGERCSDISGWALKKIPPIQLAVESNNARGLRELVDMGANVNSNSEKPNLPRALHRAVHRAYIPCVEVLLEQAEIEVDAPNVDGFTALHLCSTYAAERQRDVPEEVFTQIGAKLIKRGANVHKESTAERGEVTPLGHAIKHKRLRIVEMMVKLGQKPPTLVAEHYMEELRSIGVVHAEVLELFVEAGWAPRVVDESASSRAAAALQGIRNAVKMSPNQGPAQVSSGGRRPQPPSLPLHDAAKSGDVAALAEHLTSGEDVNAVDKHGGTALHAAAMHGHDGVVEALLKADGIVIDKLDMSKLTALYRAAVADQVGAVKALLKAGASPHAKDQKGLSLLHKVVTRPAGPVLEALLDRGASPGLGGEKGFTPLHTACTHGKSGTVEALLRAGALPGHCWNDALQSPLVVACRQGNLNAVQQLVPALSKRQLNMRSGTNAHAETPLGAAIRCVKLSMDTVAIVEALLERGADPHVRTGPMHIPPLAWVLSTRTENGTVNGVATDPKIGPLLVQALVAGGADVNQLAIDVCGFTPLQLACFDGACAEVIQALLDAGADMLAPCLWVGFTSPLHLAAYGGGNIGAVRLLLDQPQLGGLNAQGGLDRDTPLAAAIQGGQIEVVRFLLEEGADMDLLPYSEDGKTASKKSLIEMAASSGRVGIMRLLIQAKMFKDKAEQQAEDASAKGAEEAAPC